MSGPETHGPIMDADTVADVNTVEERFADIQRRLRMSSYRLQPPTWDDVIFLIEQMEGWRRQADSWAREADRLRGARNDGVDDCARSDVGDGHD